MMRIKSRIFNFKFLILNSKAGFTLMEMLVALALFSVVVTIGSDLYLTFQKTTRRTEAIQEVLTDSRFIVERMVREIREGTIDYPAYENGISGTESALYLRNSAGERILFAHYDCDRDGARECIALRINGGQSEALTSRRVRVQNVAFLITPAEDPFEFEAGSGQYASDIQPRVTLVVSIDNNLPSDNREYVQYAIQTTASSRVYRR